MTQSMNADALLDRHYLEVRARLLEIAATLDRIDRGEGSVAADPRMAEIREALQTLLTEDGTDRAERIQHIFSLPYDAQWREAMEV